MLRCMMQGRIWCPAGTSEIYVSSAPLHSYSPWSSRPSTTHQCSEASASVSLCATAPAPRYVRAPRWCLDLRLAPCTCGLSRGRVLCCYARRRRPSSRRILAESGARERCPRGCSCCTPWLHRLPHVRQCRVLRHPPPLLHRHLGVDREDDRARKVDAEDLTQGSSTAEGHALREYHRFRHMQLLREIFQLVLPFSRGARCGEGLVPCTFYTRLPQPVSCPGIAASPAHARAPSNVPEQGEASRWQAWLPQPACPCKTPPAPRLLPRTH